MENHIFYMQEALRCAREAGLEGEIPVGCVVVSPEGEIIGRGHNRRENDRDATAHAEIEAIRQACQVLQSWRLEKCSLYVTLEPCPMCAGAILNSRIGKVIYGSKESKTGSCGSVLNLFMENYGFEPQIIGGVEEKECSLVLQSFFDELRK